MMLAVRHNTAVTLKGNTRRFSPRQTRVTRAQALNKALVATAGGQVRAKGGRSVTGSDDSLGFGVGRLASPKLIHLKATPESEKDIRSDPRWLLSGH